MLEWKKLGEVCSFNRGKTITAKDACDGDVPVIAGGQAPSYFHNESNRTGESITVAGSGAYAGFVSYWNQPIFVSDAFTVDPKGPMLHKYIFHWLKMNQQRIFATQKGAGVPHVHGKDIANFEIPVPSITEQTRIVGILDTFTASIENLKQQIAQRRKQYEHYSNNLLKHVDRKESILKKLSELADIFKGPYITKKDSNEGEFPVIMGGQKVAYYIDRYNSEGESIVISRSGINAGFVSFWNQPIFVSDGYRIDNKEIINKKYLFYYLKNNEDIINSSKKGAGVPHIQSNYLLNFLILVPSLAEQQRIVSILDTFEASIANLEQQLAQRERQYEYYRNKLLTFE